MKILVLIILCSFASLVKSQEVIEAKLLKRWKDSTLVASTDHNNTYNEVYSVYNGRGEYAIIGSTYGLHFIDVETGKELDRVKGAAIGPQIIHRDFKKYKNYLYAVCDEGNSSLQIIDYSFLPDSVHVVYDKREFIITTHNIFIDTTNARMYAFFTQNQNGFNAIKLLDLQNPEKPKLMGNYNVIDGFILSNGGVHDGYVKDHIAYLNAGKGLAVVDFENPSKPKLLTGILEYKDNGYNHSGWMTDDGGYYYFADEDHGYDLKTLDIRDRQNIKIIGNFNCNSDKWYSIPHNQYVRENFLYVSYYFDGLQVFDIKNRENPIRVAYYPTSTQTISNGAYRGAWGVNPDLPSKKILVSDMQNGLYIFEPIEASLLASVNEEKQKLINVYPQPSSSFINVTGIELNDIKSIYLVDILGRKINLEVKLTEIDISKYSGVFTLCIETKNREILKKQVVHF